MVSENPDPVRCLRQYPEMFRKALATGNRMCLSSFMAAEYDDLPEAVKREGRRTFGDVNVGVAERAPICCGIRRAPRKANSGRALFSLPSRARSSLARSRSDIALYDSLIDGYRAAGLLPA